MSWIDGDAFGFESPLAPFSAQAPGHTAMLAARLALLFFALRRTAQRDGLVLGALLVASLAFRGLVLPSMLASAVAAVRGPAPAPPLPRWAPAAAAIGVLLVVAMSLRPPTPPPAPPAEPRAAIDYWRARRNLYRAHAVALAWAKTESTPGDAYVALASIDWDLGEREKARKVLRKLPAARAAELEQRWHE